MMINMKIYKYFLLAFLFLMFLGCDAEDVVVRPIPTPVKQNSSIEDFIHSIYVNYYENGPGINIGSPETDVLLSPTLLQIMHHDNELVQGEAGFLDADPICECQDHNTIKVKKIVVKKINVSKFIAKVSFINLEHLTTVEFSLLKINGLWHIDDISSADMPSMRAGLEREIKELSSH